MSKTLNTALAYGVGGGSGSGGTGLSGITSLSTPDYMVGDIETTDLASNAKEFEPGIADGGKVSFTIKYTEAIFDTLTGFRGTAQTWRVTFDDGAGFEFSGYLNKISAKADGPDKLLVLDCEIKVSGDVTPL